MQTLLDNMESGSSDGDAAEGEDMKIIIDRFEFSGGLVKVSSPVMPGEIKDINLPAIKMSGIGRKKGVPGSGEVTHLFCPARLVPQTVSD